MVLHTLCYNFQSTTRCDIKENLLIVISTDNIESIKKFPMLYSSVALERGYFKRLHVMFWGASIRVVQHDESIQKLVQEVAQTGVTFSSCVVCSDDYGATETLEAIGITCNHTGELLTEALTSDAWATLSV